MKRPVLILFLLVAVLFLVQCETVESGKENQSGGTMKVEGIVYYPDEINYTIVVPAGAQVIGAGGTNCTYIIENEGSLMAHSGTNNTYKVMAGGRFEGFAHEATNCTVQYEEGAIIEKEETGEGTTFVAGI